MMDFILKQNTCFGVQEYCLPREKVGPLEADCIRHYDQSIADLICLFLEEKCTGEGITTPEQLFERERARNYADGKALYGYAATLEHGAWLSTTQIKNIFHFIWKSPLFGESTGMDLGMIQLFRTIEKTDDPDELLFCPFGFVPGAVTIICCPIPCIGGLLTENWSGFTIIIQNGSMYFFALITLGRFEKQHGTYEK